MPATPIGCAQQSLALHAEPPGSSVCAPMQSSRLILASSAPAPLTRHSRSDKHDISLRLLGCMDQSKLLWLEPFSLLLSSERTCCNLKKVSLSSLCVQMLQAFSPRSAQYAWTSAGFPYCCHVILFTATVFKRLGNTAE